MKVFIWLFFLIAAELAYSKDTLQGFCEPITVQKTPWVLKQEKPTLILMRNSSSGDVWITHPISDASASAGWSSRLEMAQWSALVVDEKPFELSCVESKPGHEQQVPCETVLTACKLKQVKMPKNAQGTFWAAENLSSSDLITQLANRSFISRVQ